MHNIMNIARLIHKHKRLKNNTKHDTTHSQRLHTLQNYYYDELWHTVCSYLCFFYFFISSFAPYLHILKPKESYTDMCCKLTFTRAFKSLRKRFLNNTRMILSLKHDRYSKLAQTVSERQTRVPLTITASPLARDHATLTSTRAKPHCWCK